MSVYFTEDHEWIRLEGDVATIGITKHAAEQLGDIVFVEMKEAGTQVDKGDEFGTIESVKAASEAYAPVKGEVIEVNGALEDSPSIINDDAEGAGWLCKMKVADQSGLSELMDGDAYQAFIAD